MDAVRACHLHKSGRLIVFIQWHVPVCALFKGRLFDRPGSSMPATPETSGGEVEHKVYMVEGILLLVIELKLAFKPEKDHVAQVLLELACESNVFLSRVWKLTRVAAYKLNSDRNFKPQPPVYAVLTDLRFFYFFRYNGSQFARAKTIFISQESRSDFLAGMRKGMVVPFFSNAGLVAFIISALFCLRSTLELWQQSKLALCCEGQLVTSRIIGAKPCSKLATPKLFWSNAKGSWEEAGRRGLSALDDRLQL
jgi:hypothetical protein